MLRELSVTNLALIEDVRVELQPGFCAWTGETGAGKSLLLGALGLLLGDRGSADFIRSGAEELRVTGVFELVRPDLKSSVERILDQSVEDGQLILTRKLHRAGRSQAYVNEQPVALATLRALGEVLVDIHGQRENYSLLQPGYQLELLDAFGDLEPQRAAYHEHSDRLRALRKQYQELAERHQQRLRDLSLIRFERDELDAADLRAGEQPELLRERDRLAHAQSLQEFTAKAAAILYDEEGSIVERLGRLFKESQSWAGIDPRLAEISRSFEALGSEIRDLASTCRSLSERFESDPARLEEVERRLQLIRRLEAKYRTAADELVAYRATLDTKEIELQKQEDDLGGIGAEIVEVFEELKKAAKNLSKARAKAAGKLAAETRKHLATLGMRSAKLDAGLEAVPLGDDPLSSDIPSAGIDQLELMLAANPGEPARPLRKVASGGELSRTMLALKTVLAAHDRVGTLIFDEIDANIGGRLGDTLGGKLALLGRTHQVICVTHLPQVASYAKHQWTIRKTTKGKRTTTTIVALTDEKARLEELASMLRGESRSETTMQEAVAMLKASGAWRVARGE